MNQRQNIRKSTGALVCALAFVWAVRAASASVDAANGQKVFGARCAMCHGKDGKGSAAMQKMFKLPEGALNLVKEEALQKSTTEYAAMVEGGKGKMPAFKEKLSAGEIADVEAYARSLAKPADSAKAADKAAAGPIEAGAAKKIYDAKCASCHGKDGRGSAAMAKVFKVDSAALSIVDDPALGKEDAKLAAVTRDGKDKMPAYGAQLSSAEIDGIIQYLRSLTPKKDAEKQ